jgi:2-dehydro-3-deoxyphosphogluconate aldolase / (4S)-4-hydroxy-2-oxoglutarate aldolase
VKSDPFLNDVRADRLIGVVSADVGDELVECARALARGGIHFLEVAMTTPAAIDSIKKASTAFPDFRFGLGTVLDVDSARLAVFSGARFIVTPSPRAAVITLCRRYHVPVICGAFTRADIKTAQQAGATAVKVFPGEQFGPVYIRTLREEFPDVALLPIGGVTPSTISEFLRAGADAAFAGSSLLEVESVTRKDWSAITSRAQEFADAASLVSR